MMTSKVFSAAFKHPITCKSSCSCSSKLHLEWVERIMNTTELSQPHTKELMSELISQAKMGRTGIFTKENLELPLKDVYDLYINSIDEFTACDDFECTECDKLHMQIEELHGIMEAQKRAMQDRHPVYKDFIKMIPDIILNCLISNDTHIPVPVNCPEAEVFFQESIQDIMRTVEGQFREVVQGNDKQHAAEKLEMQLQYEKQVEGLKAELDHLTTRLEHEEVQNKEAVEKFQKYRRIMAKLKQEKLALLGELEMAQKKTSAMSLEEMNKRISSMVGKGEAALELKPKTGHAMAGGDLWQFGNYQN